MRPIAIVVLAGLVALGASLAAFKTQAPVEWGARWRTGHSQDDSLERIVFGSPPSLLVEITASNQGKVVLQLARPDRALKFEIETVSGTIPGRLTCDDAIKVRRKMDGVSIESVRSEAIALSPGDSMTAACAAAQKGDTPFAPGRYRLVMTADGWEQVDLRRASWRIEVREPATPSERTQFHLTEGNESFRREDYAVAAKHFELARIEAPTDMTVALALVGAYERLARPDDAVVLLEGLMSLAQQRQLDDKQIRMLTRRLALNHVASGKEEAAHVVLLQNGFTADEAQSSLRRRDPPVKVLVDRVPRSAATTGPKTASVHLLIEDARGQTVLQNVRVMLSRADSPELFERGVPDRRDLLPVPAVPIWIAIEEGLWSPPKVPRTASATI